MSIPQRSWRKLPRQKAGDVICTRLILSAVFSAVKKHIIQRGSVRAICFSKCPNRTVTGGAWPTLNPVPIHASPVQADKSYLFTKINGSCCSNTRPLAVTNADIQFQQKEDTAKKGCILWSITWIFTCLFPVGSWITVLAYWVSWSKTRRGIFAVQSSHWAVRRDSYGVILPRGVGKHTKKGRNCACQSNFGQHLRLGGKSVVSDNQY